MAHLRATLQFGKKLAQEGMIKPPNIADKLNNLVFPLSKYLKYGLLTDDLLRENEVVKEALKRLPKDVYQERHFRMARAIGLSANKDVLPESEWTTHETDVSYLRPFVQQVIAEHQEKSDWNSGKLE